MTQLTGTFCWKSRTPFISSVTLVFRQLEPTYLERAWCLAQPPAWRGCHFC